MKGVIEEQVDGILQMMRQPAVSVEDLLAAEQASASLADELRGWVGEVARIRRVAIAEAAARTTITAVAERTGITRQRVSQIMHEEAGTR